MSWILDLLGGKGSKPEEESVQPAKKADWFDGIVKAEAITKEATIQDDRVKHVKNLSTDALAHIYTELILKKENKKIPENYVEEYIKQKEAVLKDREKIEAAILELIPVHTQDRKWNKVAAKTSILDVDSIWMVKDVDGEEVIVRAAPDAIDMKKESVKEVKANNTVFSPNDLVKNKSFDIAQPDEVGVIEEFDNLFLDASFICCNFEKTGRCWVKASQVSKLTVEELALRKSALEQVSFSGPLSDYMLSKYQVNMKESGLHQLELEIKSALGKTVATLEEVPSDVLEKVANDFIQDPDYANLYDRPIAGHSPKTDNMNQQVPVVYRNTDDDAHNPNTKDFGEIYPNKLAPEKQSSLKCDQCGQPAGEGSVLQIADGTVCPSCQKEYHKEMGEPYPTTGPLVKQMKLSKLDSTATVQYVDETGMVKKPEELGVTNVDTAPEELATADGKKYKKQKLAAVTKEATTTWDDMKMSPPGIGQIIESTDGLKGTVVGIEDKFVQAKFDTPIDPGDFDKLAISKVQHDRKDWPEGVYSIYAGDGFKYKHVWSIVQK